MDGVASIPTDPSRKVQVISAGYSRTGTVSISLALEKLLDGPILHGGTQILVRDDDYCLAWIKAYEAREAGDKQATLKLVRKATAGFVGAADLPPADFMSEMVELYPDAKVVLVPPTSRTTPSWLGIVLAPIPGWRYLVTFARLYSRSTLRLAGLEDPNAIPKDLIERGGPRKCLFRTFLKPTEKKVRSLEPLCKFLGAPVPNEPFPRANDAKAADQYATKILFKVFMLWLSILTGAGAIIYFGDLQWQGR
ncbi:hypothetical protein F5Y01DRAFT_308191 [Xylaria sp. FL0043]|nr:hypothetical protein F5Y01DRAFT_308191 [Xylaria sp. FL0043]